MVKIEKGKTSTNDLVLILSAIGFTPTLSYKRIKISLFYFTWRLFNLRARGESPARPTRGSALVKTLI